MGPPALSVLIVDDDPDHADLLAEFVMACGHYTLVARNGSEAMRLAQMMLFDVILLDIGLPDGDGTQLVKELRGRGITSRIIATTGYGSAVVRDLAVRAGIDVFLLKPFSLSRIRAELDDVCEARLRN
jgi:DNA-binding response OmpR family regulator